MTTPAPHHSVFTGRMPFLPPNQQRQSTEGIPDHKSEKLTKIGAQLTQKQFSLSIYRKECQSFQMLSNLTR